MEGVADPILRGHQLLGFVDGSEVTPPTTINVTETIDGKLVEKVISNPEYNAWLLKDQ